MKNKCVKLASIVLMLVFALTGCSLIEIDPIMQLEEDIAARKSDYATVLASYNGGEITVADVAYQFSSEYSYISYIYSMYGYSLTDADVKNLLQDIVESNMDTRAMLLHQDEAGVSLTEEEKAECLAAAEEAYQEAYDAAYEDATGATEEEKALQTEYALIGQGQTMEVLINQQEWTLILEKMEEALGADITEIPDDELELMLTEHAIEDEQTYSEDLDAFESDMLDEEKCITWMPMGYRTVKHILLTVDDEMKTAVSDARAALNTAEDELEALEQELADSTDDDSEEGEEPRSAEEIQADIDAKTEEVAAKQADVDAAEAECIASVQDKLDEIYAKLDEGEDFEAVMAEYGEDPGMKEGAGATRGYYVSAQSNTWDVNFRDAAMDLENVGDYSATPVVSTSGVHIIYYDSEVISGQKQLADIYDEFLPVALQDAREEHLDELVDGWVEQLAPKYSVDKYFKMGN